MAALSRLFTVGHSTRPLEELIEILRGAGVERLVDVRRFPGSRRHPQFAQESLAVRLPAAGVSYRHDERLGGRRRGRPDSPNTAWRNASFRAYADHLATAELLQAVAELEREAAERRIALMCAEAVPWRCHRRLLADLLVARGHQVVHLLAAGREQPHEMYPEAVVSGSTLVYPARGQRGLFDEQRNSRRPPPYQTP